MPSQYIRFFEEISIEDVPLVGGKTASLGEMYRQLSSQNIKIPNGFAITADAYREMLDQANVWPKLHDILDELKPDDIKDLADKGKRAREVVFSAPLPDDIKTEIVKAYQRLEGQYGPELSVAVRSSATAEDLPGASFAGQQDTYLNVHGIESLLDSCKRCFASLFTDRAIHYRIDQGFDHFSVALSVCVMKMVRADLAASGVMFSLDTETGFRDSVFITGAYGLGENVVQGAVDPDEFYVHKPTFNLGFRSVLRRVLGKKKIKMVYSEGRTREPICNITTSNQERQRFCIADQDILQLADYAIKIENYYSDQAGSYKPMDIEWAKDGLDGELYIVQARPETVMSQKQINQLEEYQLQGNSEVLATGRAIGSKIATGPARIIASAAHLEEFQAGEVLIADLTTPDWEPVMKIASAIVTNRAGEPAMPQSLPENWAYQQLLAVIMQAKRSLMGNS